MSTAPWPWDHLALAILVSAVIGATAYALGYVEGAQAGIRAMLDGSRHVEDVPRKETT